jgi:aminomethyltransferase
MDDAKTTQLKRTPLNALHRELQARMVPFAGYEMPVQYPAGIKAEHEHTRSRAGLFDISHMGQIRISGDNSAEQLEGLVPGDIQGLKTHRQRYTVFTNDSGGILDDLMITRLADSFFLVVNAACKTADYDYLNHALGHNNDLSLLDDKALLALQGPSAVKVLGVHAPDIAELPFLSAGVFTISGIECLIHRCGYTGEDGFELSVMADKAEQLARTLLNDPLVRPIGLGARDTLRLEAGLCLYGHDLGENISPVEADLSWVIAAKYRNNKTTGARFPGADTILNQLIAGPQRLRRGFMPEGRAPVREGALIFDGEGKKVGIITSGGYGPTVAGPIAMGYVDTTTLQNAKYTVKIRSRTYNLSMVKLPFVKHRYFKK